MMDEDEVARMAWDGRDRSGTHSGVISGAGRTIQRICDMNRIGQVNKIGFPVSGEMTFLLAALNGQTDVWIIPLPRTPSQ